MKKEFLSYFTLGYPGIEEDVEIIKGAIDGGATGIEIGIPFSDPIADGGVIQYAHHIAITRGTKTGDLFTLMDLLGEYRGKAKFYVMSYLNPIINYPKGLDVFVRKLKETGICGLILPDFPFAEAKRGKVKVDFPLILFATPDTQDTDILEYKEYNPPFVYYIAQYGTTGERASLPEDIKEKIINIKEVTKLPLYVGFGISTKEQVRALYDVADGVIVGSHLIKLIMKHEKDKLKNVRDIIKEEVKILTS